MKHSTCHVCSILITLNFSCIFIPAIEIFGTKLVFGAYSCHIPAIEAEIFVEVKKAQNFCESRKQKGNSQKVTHQWLTTSL